MNHTKRLTVLLVEDEPADAHLVRLALNEGNVQVDLHHVCDGVEVFSFLRHEGAYASVPRPDLILLDLNMPRMNGHECLAALKNDHALRAIPVVILTTSEAERDIVASYQLGASGYVTKPVDVAQFIEAIRALCNYWITLVRLPGNNEVNHHD